MRWLVKLSLFMLCSIYHCAGEEASFEENIKTRCRVDLPSCFPEQLDLAELGKSLTGELVFPEKSKEYTSFNFQWNNRTKTYPLVHVMVRNANDIRAAILFARKHNLHVTIKSSGADFLGRSSAHSSFSINLMLMKGMSVTNTSARSEHGEITVETGVTWKEIYMELENHKRLIVGPGARIVTPAGYTMGGGHSPMSPSLGLAVDNVLEIQVVLADGRISTCTENRTLHVYPDGTETAENNGDLFWALRGGGGGTFGVVVYYVFKLHQAPEAMVTVLILLPFFHQAANRDTAAEVFKQYYKWTKRAPPSWGGYFSFTNYPATPDSQTGTSSLFLLKAGPWDENTMSELQEFTKLNETLSAGFMPLFSISNISSYWGFGQLLNDEYDPRNRRAYTIGSLIPAETHNEDLTDLLLGELHNNEDVPLSCTFIRLGGKVKEHEVNTSSLHPGWRSAQSCVSCYVGIAENANMSLKAFEDQARLKTNAAEYAERLRGLGDGEYFNEADADNSNWKLDLWGRHYPELLRIKVRYDPDNFFFCHHCIGSDYTTFRSTINQSAAIRASILILLLIISANYL